MDWLTKSCKPCTKGTLPYTAEEVHRYVGALVGWSDYEDHRVISTMFEMQSFADAVELVNKIAQIADNENHHPNIHITQYKMLQIDLSTHSIGGLSENDFIMAAKIDQIKPANCQQLSR
ncbi:MAG: 4a-hydroxytetrahydrobiopterin dehydratase [Candidatus Omnitrophota bacterium]|jgi:4a-hydroxytetrahydrobiopterin dehydratase